MIRRWVANSVLVGSRHYSSNFTQFGLSPSLINGLNDMKVMNPTTIQKMVISEAVKSKKPDILFAAQTGTGKTLAYLLPIIHHLQHSEKLKLSFAKPNRPRAVILVPSRELGLQVSLVASRLAHFAKFRTLLITGGAKHKPQKEGLSRPLDLLVATPGRFAKYLKDQQVFLSQVQHLVIDEVDTMYDKEAGFLSSMEEILTPLRSRIQSRGDSIQYLMAAATIKSPLDKIILKNFSQAKVIAVKNLHQSPTSIKETFVPVGLTKKHPALCDAIRSNLKTARRTMVFCNSSSSCRSTEHFLNESGFSSTSLHGDIPSALRKANFADFNSGKYPILVCTDIAARGLDTQELDHVILFDFPKTSVEYLHRIGRTGRGGNPGIVTSLVTKRDATLAKLIENASKMKQDIAELKSDFIKKAKNQENKFNSIKKQRGNEESNQGDHSNMIKVPSWKKTKKTGTKKIKSWKIR